MNNRLFVPYLHCGHAGTDGTCQHPLSNTPECNQHVCPIYPADPQEDVLELVPGVFVNADLAAQVLNHSEE